MTFYINLAGIRTPVEYKVYHLTDGKVPFQFHEIQCRGSCFRGDTLIDVIRATKDVFESTRLKYRSDDPTDCEEEMVR